MFRKIISIIVLCAFVAASVFAATGAGADPAGENKAVSSGNKGVFSFSVIEQLYQQGGNIVFSPVSLEIALSMAADGAKDETLAEILAAMNIASTDEIISAIPEDIHSANAAFTSDNAPLYREYINRLNEAYGAEWFEIDENVVDKANKWANENTNGLIDPLLTEKPDPMTGLILINAVSMDADWQKPFFEDGVKKDAFHTPEGEIEVDMMYRETNYDYAEKDGVQIIKLPYANSTLDMYIMLPEEGGMQALAKILSEQGVYFFSEGLNRQDVDFALPKMDVSGQADLKDILSALGVEKAFGAEANFSGMSEVPMYIAEIFQKARIQIDESGTKAAASTVIAMPMMGMPPSEGGPVEMHVNRPFAFAVADRINGSVCFAGVIENPLAE